MTWDRSDISEAYFVFLSLHHDGQGSKDYARLSRLLRRLRPAPSLRGPNDLTPNGQWIYRKLVRASKRKFRKNG